MPYVKTTWVDRLVQFPGRFTKSNETSGSVTLAADPGTVTQTGTPLSAANMNKIENGLESATTLAEGSLQKSGGTMTGLLTLSGAPTATNHATTKTYVDTADNNRVLKAGDTMTGSLTMPAGTAAAPTIRDVNDTDTGIFFPAAGRFGISTNGTSRFEIDGSGIATLGGSNVGAKLLSFSSLNGSITSTVYTSVVSFKWETAYATNCTIYFEVNGYSSVNGATAYFQLWNTTDATQVVELTTTSNVLTTMVTSSSISMLNGKTYTIRARHNNASQTAVMLCGYLKIT